MCLTESFISLERLLKNNRKGLMYILRIKINFLLIFLLQMGVIFSQNKPIVKDNRVISSDCKEAIPITILNTSTYGPTVPPNGFGEFQEIKQSNKLTFEKEHNTAWYLLSIQKTGELIFEINPLDTANDYDFLLYSYTDSIFCDLFQQNKIKPLRNNLSNITKSIRGITGLKPNAQENYIGKGKGDPYSKSIRVKKGEKYMLIIDNVSLDGKGHTIFFNFIKEVEINGKIVNYDSLSVIANVILSDIKGNVIAQAKSDKNGNYAIKTTINENQNYNATVISDSDFVQSKTINTKTLKGGATFENTKITLSRLKKGNKFQLEDINFKPGSPILLPESYSSVELLYQLMKQNKKLIIQIEGHVNADYKNPKGEKIKPNEKVIAFNQKLSENRAMTIYKYLLDKNIDKERMTTIGYSGKYMIYPNPKNDSEASANRRVEIKIISVNGE